MPHDQVRPFKSPYIMTSPTIQQVFERGFAAQWGGYIKDYDGGTLMEAKLHAKICYTEFAPMLKKQRTALDDRIKLQSNSHIVYRGLEVRALAIAPAHLFCLTKQYPTPCVFGCMHFVFVMTI